MRYLSVSSCICLAMASSNGSECAVAILPRISWARLQLLSKVTMTVRPARASQYPVETAAALASLLLHTYPDKKDAGLREENMTKELQRSEDASQMKSRKRVSGWTYFKLFLTLLCTVMVIVLVVQNAEAVRVNLLFWNIELSMALVVLFSLLVGAVIGASVCGRIVWKKS